MAYHMGSSDGTRRQEMPPGRVSVKSSWIDENVRLNMSLKSKFVFRCAARCVYTLIHGCGHSHRNCVGFYVELHELQREATYRQ